MGQPVWSARLERAAEKLALVAVGGLLLLAVGTALDVRLRYAFASPIRGFVDIASLAGAVLLAACFPYVLVSRTNIVVDMLGRSLGRGSKLALDRFGAFVTAAFFILMAWQYVGFAVELRDTRQVIPVLRWSVWPWWAAVALFVVLAAAGATLTVWKRNPEDDSHA
jgi:TRAP-type C4-dicarboxylate transport system permease small subunit